MRDEQPNRNWEQTRNILNMEEKSRIWKTKIYRYKILKYIINEKRLLTCRESSSSSPRSISSHVVFSSQSSQFNGDERPEEKPVPPSRISSEKSIMRIDAWWWFHKSRRFSEKTKRLKLHYWKCRFVSHALSFEMKFNVI